MIRSIGPTAAYENESVFLSRPLQQWPTTEHKQLLAMGFCAPPKTSWHETSPGKGLRESVEGYQNVGILTFNVQKVREKLMCTILKVHRHGYHLSCVASFLQDHKRPSSSSTLTVGP